MTPSSHTRALMLALMAFAALFGVLLVCGSCAHSSVPQTCVTVAPLENHAAYPTCATVQFLGQF